VLLVVLPPLLRRRREGRETREEVSVG